MGWKKAADLNHRDRGYWSGINNRRQFFSDIAGELRFDPMQPDNWSRVTRDHIIAKKVKHESYVEYSEFFELYYRVLY